MSSLPGFALPLRQRLLYSLRRLRDRPGCMRPLLDVRALPSATTTAHEQEAPAARWDADRALAWTVFGWSDFGNSMQPVEQALLEALHGALGNALQRQNVMPRLPSVIPLLLAGLRDPHGDAQSLAKLIARDPLLVAEVVRVAQSPAYGGSTSGGTLVDVVLRLGHDGLRRVVAAVALRPIFQAGQHGLTRKGGTLLWAHAERAGYAAGQLGQGQPDAFAGYLAALAMDIGWISLLRLLDGLGMQPPTTPARVTVSELCEAAWTMTRHVAAQWHFPEPVHGAIECAYSGRHGEAAIVALAARVRLARSAATRHLLGAHPPAPLQVPQDGDDPLQAALDAAFGDT